jgi:RNA polymerase sigma-70 factor (ECF subfamily)
MAGQNAGVDQLLERARRGDRSARERLLAEHRARLRKMIAVRMDPRLTVRVDPSDVVQEALIEAARRLSDYLRQGAIPFYPWLRNLAAERLIQLQRLHIRAQRRSVKREERGPSHLSDASAAKLARYVLSGQHDPLSRLHKAEMLTRVRAALDKLPERDREILVLRYLEQLSIAETAEVLNVNTAVVKMRHLRALQRLRELLDDGSSEG